jgi:hypothetical protein
MPPPDHLLRNADVDWDAWPVDAYLAECYAKLFPLDDAVIVHHSAFYRRIPPDSVARSVEFGAGPNLYPLLLAGAASRCIEALDRSAANLAYLRRQIHDGPDPRWLTFHRRCRELNPALPTDPGQILARVKMIAGDGLDLSAGAYDLASMHFVAEGATEDPDEFARFCGRFVAAVRPGGYLVAAFIEGLGRYRAGTDRQWPGYPVDRDVVRAVFSPWTSDLVVDRIDRDATPVGFDYTGVVLLTARRREADGA